MTGTFLFAISVAAALGWLRFIGELPRPWLFAGLGAAAVAIVSALLAVRGRTYYSREETFLLAFAAGGVMALVLNWLAIAVGRTALKNRSAGR